MDKPRIPHIHSKPNFTPLGKHLTHDVQSHSILQPVVRLPVMFDLNERSNSPCERSTQVHEHTWAYRARPDRYSHTVLVPAHISSVPGIGTEPGTTSRRGQEWAHLTHHSIQTQAFDQRVYTDYGYIKECCNLESQRP
jgi:hypothetical protein